MVCPGAVEKTLHGAQSVAMASRSPVLRSRAPPIGQGRLF